MAKKKKKTDTKPVTSAESGETKPSGKGATTKAKPTSPTKKTGARGAKKKPAAAPAKSQPAADQTTTKPRKKKLAQAASRQGKKKLASASVLKGYDKADAAGATQGDSLSESQLRKAKSGLTRKDLNRYRGLLLSKRAEILGDVEALEQDAQNGSGGGISYEHMADAGSDNFEQEFTLGLVESERKLLAEINEALLRMKKGIYGVCLERGVPIGTVRLDAKPWAKWCIEVVREKERRGLL